MSENMNGVSAGTATEIDLNEAVKVWKEHAGELLKATEEEIQKVTKEM